MTSLIATRASDAFSKKAFKTAWGTCPVSAYICVFLKDSMNYLQIKIGKGSSSSRICLHIRCHLQLPATTSQALFYKVDLCLL